MSNLARTAILLACLLAGGFLIATPTAAAEPEVPPGVKEVLCVMDPEGRYCYDPIGGIIDKPF